VSNAAALPLAAAFGGGQSIFIAAPQSSASCKVISSAA